MISNETVRIIRCKDDTGKYRYVLEKYSQRPMFTRNMERAYHYQDSDLYCALSMIDLIKTQYSSEVELIQIDIQRTTTPVDLNSTEVMEIRRHIALKKLTDLDIQALGLEPLKVYDKLKFHGVESSEMDSDDSDSDWEDDAFIDKEDMDEEESW